MIEDTIAAISTPPGQGGIGIVRLSGSMAVKIVEEVFQSKNDKVLSKLPSHRISYGHIVSDGEIIDEVLVTVMRAPCTYTKEDIVEINCHGGIIPLREILELVLRKGARLSLPGEFTKRAFLNGRIDLAQAEAVADIINSKTNASRRVALAQLNGDISRQVEDYIQKIQDIVAQVEAGIDFAGEGIVSPSRILVRRTLLRLVKDIDELKSTADVGLTLREGLRLTIVGRPNVGKSTLFNALLGRERVIVTPIPGTTRDVVEETVDIGGIPVRVADTAGVVRNSTDLIEREGVEKALHWSLQADLVIIVVDGSELLTEEDGHILEGLKERKTITVINKCDLPVCVRLSDVERFSGKDGVLMISAIGGKGLDELRSRITRTVWRGEIDPGEKPLVTNIRHLDALRRTVDALRQALADLDRKEEEILAFDLKESLMSLGEIGGKVTSEDILDRIFSEFCIGK